MVNKAIELAKTHGWFLTRQFENEANPDMHSRTTAREIIDDFAGERLDYWVTGYRHRRHAQGRRARARQGAARHQDRGVRAAGRAAAWQRCRAGAQCRRLARERRTRPSSRIRCRAGRPDFIPKLTGDAVDMERDRPHHRDPGSGRDALQPRARAEGRDLRRHHGGRDLRGRAQGLRRGARRAPPCSACCPTPASAISARRLFADIPADMNEDEIKISRSTPGAQMPTT